MPESPFATLIPDAQHFLAELAAQNTRDWFTANKPRFQRDLQAPAHALLDVVGAGLEKLCAAPVSPKLFRQNRDVRCSKDKSPYKTHLHMIWTCGADGPAFFFGIEPGRILLGGGMMAFSSARLADWRARIAGPEGATLQSHLTALLAVGFYLREPELKRIPAPHAPNHPQGELLRRKSLIFLKDVQTPPDDLPAALLAEFTRVMPVQDWLRTLP
ncbi:TIGR02453 family protein [Thalassovita sp.]|uniref:TIGR02453 family protein n=1 Tax=Thalassovita sp. TaxID=1979401 RepID=UPI0029DE7E54|nr:TIGR02453 family protein [Thalassovita sp.]